jgi:hypothetical protein
MKPMTSFVFLLQSQKRKNKMISAMLIAQLQNVTTLIMNASLLQLITVSNYLENAQLIAELKVVTNPTASFVLVLQPQRRKEQMIFVQQIAHLQTVTTLVSNVAIPVVETSD